MEARFYVIESCMRPNGAWAHTVLTGNEADCRRFYGAHEWEGPDHGILWGHEIELVRHDHSGRMTLARRHAGPSFERQEDGAA